MNFEIVNLKKLKSTNSYAMKLIRKGNPPEGVVIWADEQTDGRGHTENSWESEKGKNLTCSLILKPVFIEPSKQFVITQIISIALCQLIGQYVSGENVKIKWPNDIYVNDKKVAGILIQNTLRGELIDYSVIGMGVNINQEKFLSDAPNPISLRQLTDEEHNIEEFLHRLLNEINIIYSGDARQASPDLIHETYLGKLYRLNQWAEFKHGDEKIEAQIIGIGQYGRLELKLRNGEKKEIDFKEVEFVI